MATRYTVLKNLGVGGHGAVRLIRIEDDNGVRTVAAKWLHAATHKQEALTRRMADEAHMLADLVHEHLVRPLGVEVLEGQAVLLLEPLEGANLRPATSGMPLKAAVEAIGQAAAGLEAARTWVPAGSDGPLGLVHRDLKPDNLFVTVEGVVKVLDFNAATASFPGREPSAPGTQQGTPLYMSPERRLGDPATPASDVYALGVILAELCTGSRLAQTHLTEGAFKEDLQDWTAPLREWPDLAGLIRSCCAWKPDERPTLADLLTDCRRVASALDGPDLTEWAREWVVPHTTLPEATATMPAQLQQRAWLLPLLAALAVIALGALLALLLAQ